MERLITGIGLPILIIAAALAAAGLVAGALTAFIVIAGTLSGIRSWRPAIVTPQLVEAGSAPLPALRGDNPFPRDRAWPSYLSAQRRVDLNTAWSRCTGLLGAGWRRIGASDSSFVAGAIATVTWLAASLGVLITATALLTLCRLVLLVEWIGWIAVVGLLRSVDLVVRKRRKADTSCPHCYHIAPRPCYKCSGCGQIHRDVRPGRLGAVWRRCGCGTVLPTTVLRAAHRLEPQCVACGRPLRSQAGALTDVRIPVIGPVLAGKTRLVYAGLLALRDAAAATGGRLDFVDHDSRTAFEHGAQVITSGGDTVKTKLGLHPAISARLELPTRRRGLLHLFDAAGESYSDPADNAELEFLDHAQGLVLVIDPFSIRSVRDQLAGLAARAGVATLAVANPAAQDPEVAYQITSRRLRTYGVKTRAQWLAVTVVKADLLAGLPPSQGLGPGLVRQWLVKAGLDNLVLSAERDFGTVRYFVTASIPEAKAGPAASPANPFDWLLSRCGLGIRTTDNPTEASPTPSASPGETEEEQRHEPANA
jgi:Double-GTPase 2